MTTHTSTLPRTESPTAVLAATGAATAAILTAVGTFVDVLGPTEQRSDGMAEFYSWLVVVGAIAVATALVFGLAVRRASQHNASSRGLVLAVLAVPTVMVAWTGLPPVLAAGALACALLARQHRGRFSGQDRATFVLAALALAGAVAFALAG